MKRIITITAFAILSLIPTSADAQGWYAAQACTPYRGLYGELSGDSAALCASTTGYSGYYSSGQATAGYWSTGWGNVPTSYRERQYSPWGGYAYCVGWYC